MLVVGALEWSGSSSTAWIPSCYIFRHPSPVPARCEFRVSFYTETVSPFTTPCARTPSLVPPPACMASFCVFFFYRPTGRRGTLDCRCDHAGMSLQTNNSEALRFKRAAFYNGLKSRVGLAAAKAAALRVNLNVQGCGIVAPPMHAPSRTPLLLPLLLSHNLPTPRVH